MVINYGSSFVPQDLLTPAFVTCINTHKHQSLTSCIVFTLIHQSLSRSQVHRHFVCQVLFYEQSNLTSLHSCSATEDVLHAVHTVSNPKLEVSMKWELVTFRVLKAAERLLLSGIGITHLQSSTARSMHTQKGWEIRSCTMTPGRQTESRAPASAIPLEKTQQHCSVDWEAYFSMT